MPKSKKCILLLPNPDFLQMSNVYKYMTTSQYDAVFTPTTMALFQSGTDQYKDNGFRPSSTQPQIGPWTEKILIMGHGNRGTVSGISVADLISCILESGVFFSRPADNALKLKFDTCYGAADAPQGQTILSVLEQVKIGLKSATAELGIQTTINVSGGIGPIISAFPGKGTRRYLTDNNAKIGQISSIQQGAIATSRINPNASYVQNHFLFSDTHFNPRWESATILHHAQLASQRIVGFLTQFKGDYDRFVQQQKNLGIDYEGKALFKRNL